MLSSFHHRVSIFVPSHKLMMLRIMKAVKYHRTICNIACSSVFPSFM